MDQTTIFKSLAVKELNGPISLHGNMSIEQIIEAQKELFDGPIETISVKNQNGDLIEIWHYQKGLLI